VRNVRLSDIARRQVEALNRPDAARFYEISYMLSEFLAPLQRAGLVRSAPLYSRDYLAYSDKQIPLLVYFEVVSDERTEAEEILIHQVLRTASAA
jgi:hypothetical protein